MKYKGELENQISSAQDLLNDSRVASLLNDKDVLITYLRMKTTQEDWKSVADAATDIREIEAKISQMK